MLTAMQAADQMIIRFAEKGEPIDNLKLQKLLYYAQGWNLAIKGERFFDSSIVAKERGPAPKEQVELHQADDCIPVMQEPNAKKGDFLLLDVICDVYGEKTGEALSEMTHKESPWKETKQGQCISDETTRKFFMTADQDENEPVHADFLDLWVKRKYKTTPFYKNGMEPLNLSAEELSQIDSEFECG